MKLVLIMIAAILGLFANSKPLMAQTPYDDFAPSETPKPILSLPNAIYRITNTDTTAKVKYLLFEKQSQTLMYVGANDTLLAAETLQARELKWWSIDPLANEAAGIGPYTFVDDNPAINVDPDGKKTLYYSQSGVLLFTSNDNLPNSISVVNNSDIKQFVKQYYDVNFSKDKVHTDDFNKGLRSLSVNYMVDGIVDLFDESLVTPFKEDGRYVDPSTGVTPLNLHPELSSYMYDDGAGNVSVGKERFVGSPRGGSVGNNLQPKPKAKIHSHSSDIVTYLDRVAGGIYRTNGSGGLSETDILGATREGYYDIMVDPNSIHLYGGPGANIEVPKSVFKKQ